MARFTQWFWGNYFPGTNLHELNLDWILSEIKRMEDEIDKFESWVVEEIKQEMTEFRAEFTKLQQDFEAEMKKDIDEQFAQKMQEIDEELAQFEQHIDQKLADFEQQELQPIKIDITNLQDVQGQHTTQLRGLRSDVDSNTTAIRENTNNIANIVSFDAYIEKRVDDNRHDININTASYSALTITVNETREIMTQEHFANLEMRNKLENDMRTLNSSVTAYVVENTNSIISYVQHNTSSLTSFVNNEIDDMKEIVRVNTTSVVSYVNRNVSSMIAYVDTAIDKINPSSIIAYVDSRDNLYNSSMIAYVDDKIKNVNMDTSSIVAYVDNSVHNLQEQVDIHTENINSINEELDTVHDIAAEALADAQAFLNQRYGNNVVIAPETANSQFNVTINNGIGFAYAWRYSNAGSGFLGYLDLSYSSASNITRLGMASNVQQTDIGWTIPVTPGTSLHLVRTAGSGNFQSECQYRPIINSNVARTVEAENELYDNIKIIYHNSEGAVKFEGIEFEKEYSLNEIKNIIPQHTELD